MGTDNSNPLAKELRLGLVMYGGVSLAIYIYGVAVEFLRLARQEGVYKEIVQRAGVKPIIDIISGSSAGGINGLLLAKALAIGGELSPLKELWIEEGDLAKLVDDDNPTPLSLLDSKYYKNKILDALKQIDQTKGCCPPLSFPLDLFITATDLDGILTEWNGPYFDRPILTKQYGTVFHFKVRPRYDLFKEFTDEAQEEEEEVPWSRLKEVLGDDWSQRNDFDPDIPPRTGEDISKIADADPDKNYYLANVAASTSAFPVAFAPVKFSQGELKMMRALFGSDTFGENEGTVIQKEQAVVYGDGGMVNNKPFEYTVETIFHRHATGPVDRKLIFVEPDPALTEGESRLASQKEVDGLDSLNKFLSASFYESVSADLATVMARNRRIEEIQEILIFLEKELKRFLRVSGHKLREGYQDQAIYFPYRQLKVQQLRQELQGRVLGLTAEQEKLSEAQQKVRDQFDNLLAQAYGNFEDAEQVGRFLQTFDYPFRIRRIRYFINKINDWLNQINFLAHTASKKDKEKMATLQEMLGDLKAKLYVFVEVYNHQVWHIWAKEIAEKKPPTLADRANLEQVLGQVEDKYQALMGAPVQNRSGSTSPEGTALDYKALTLELLKSDQMAQAVQTLKSLQPEYPSLGELLDSLFDNWRDEDFEIQTEIEEIFKAYEFLDMYLYPTMVLADIGEADPIEVIRVSPKDAFRYKDSVASKVTGEKLMHFSAFLKKSWRENDILWGRLDAAEIIFRILLPNQADGALLTRLTQEILRDEFRDITERRKNEVGWAVLTDKQQAEVSRILDELIGLEKTDSTAQGMDNSSSLPAESGKGLKELVYLEGTALEDFFRRYYTVGLEGLQAVPSNYLLETTVRSLRTVEKLVDRRSQQTQATGLQRLIHGFGLLFHLPYAFVVTLGGAEKTPIFVHLINFLVLLSAVLLALLAFGVIEVQRWLLIAAIAILIVRFWNYIRDLLDRWVRYALLFAVLLLLMGYWLIRSGAILIQDPQRVGYAGLGLIGLFLLGSLIAWLSSQKRRS